MTYSPQGTQLDVIESRAPLLVVLGGAGTGKTVTAAAAAAAHLTEADVVRESLRRRQGRDSGPISLPAHARVLFLSFSRTAVSQVIDRAGGVVGRLLDRIEVATFHGFAWRIISDFGPRYGFPPPLTILSQSETRVPGGGAGLVYDDLMPAAIRILERPTVSEHYARRYSLVICDEFQDTDDHEWCFLQSIAPAARRILLGDMHQCIYAEMKSIDPDARISEALSLPGAECIELPPASHRDPSGVLPAAADAARERRFDDPAIQKAVVEDRIRVTRTGVDEMHDAILKIVRSEREEGHTVSVFTHTNAATAALSDALTDAGVQHEQVGMTEAYAEALHAQLAFLQYALEGTSPRRPLAVYVAANHRAKVQIVTQIAEASNAAFERAFDRLLADLEAAGGPPPDADELASLVTTAYGRLGTHPGQQTWLEAARRTRLALRRLKDGTPFGSVVADIEAARQNSLVGDSGLRSRRLQVMNLHQTKGREADTTILLLQPDEFHGYERAPFPKLSRLLYVVLTRARKRAHLVVPPQVHELWEPLVGICEAHGRGSVRSL